MAGAKEVLLAGVCSPPCRFPRQTHTELDGGLKEKDTNKAIISTGVNISTLTIIYWGTYVIYFLSPMKGRSQWMCARSHET